MFLTVLPGIVGLAHGSEQRVTPSVPTHPLTDSASGNAGEEAVELTMPVSHRKSDLHVCMLMVMPTQSWQLKKLP